MANPSKTTSALARRIWQTMFEFLMRTAPERGRSLGRRGLTPNDSRALASLDSRDGRTMRSLADEWECDASNATWIVDRLEKLGLAERRTVPHDRRLKLVVLTARGLKTKAGLMEEFLTPPAALLGVDQGDLETLQRALEKLPFPPGAALPANRKRTKRGQPPRERRAPPIPTGEETKMTPVKERDQTSRR
jgi:DNA-binding MarR family transcriptional regulator